MTIEEFKVGESNVHHIDIFPETIEGWTEKMRVLDELNQAWQHASLEELQEKFLPVVTTYAQGAETWIRFAGPMVGKILGEHSPAHENCMIASTARDFYAHMSELSDDPDTKTRYVSQSSAMQELVEMYESFIEVKLQPSSEPTQSLLTT